MRIVRISYSLNNPAKSDELRSSFGAFYVGVSVVLLADQPQKKVMYVGYEQFELRTRFAKDFRCLR